VSPRSIDHPLQPGDRAPNIVLDAISREGKIAFDDFRGRTPLLVGLFRGLHCPFCRKATAGRPFATVSSASLWPRYDN
jgi:hypothetical protein